MTRVNSNQDVAATGADTMGNIADIVDLGVGDHFKANYPEAQGHCNQANFNWSH